MKLFAKLFGGKSTPAASTAPVQEPAKDITSTAIPAPTEPTPEAAAQALAENVAQQSAEDENIWELSDEDSAVLQAAAQPAPRARRRRNATRLIGFEHSDETVVDMFDQPASTAGQDPVKFPVGWMLVVEGEGRGHAFGLVSGLNQVGRSDENSISLDFGDNAISRTNHFAVVYDDEERKFILGHGGKSNIVRLNGSAVISNEDLSDGDKIKVGDTVLQLKTLCGPDFEWAAKEDQEGKVNVAIA